MRDIEVIGERNRGLYVIKSRGMAHSNQVREFVLTRRGLRLIPVYLGASGVLTGSSRVAQEAREKREGLLRQQETERRRLELDRKRKAMETMRSKPCARRSGQRRKISNGLLDRKSGGKRSSMMTAPPWRAAARPGLRQRRPR